MGIDENQNQVTLSDGSELITIHSVNDSSNRIVWDHEYKQKVLDEEALILRRYPCQWDVAV